MQGYIVATQGAEQASSVSEDLVTLLMKGISVGGRQLKIRGFEVEADYLLLDGEVESSSGHNAGLQFAFDGKRSAADNIKDLEHFVQHHLQ